MKKEHKDILAQEAKLAEQQAAAEAEGFDLFGAGGGSEEAGGAANDDAKEVPEIQPKPTVEEAFTVSSSIKYASQHEKSMARKEKEQVWAKKRRERDAHKISNPYATVLMSDENRRVVEDLLRESGLAKSASATKSKDAMTDPKTIAFARVETTQYCVKLGFDKRDVVKAVDAVGVDRDQVMNWLLLHVDEKRLPRTFDPRGKQFQVVPKKAKRLSFADPLTSSAKTTACVDPAEGAVLSLVSLLKTMDVTWPIPKGDEENLDEIKEEENMVLESIFINGEVTRKKKMLAFDGSEIEHVELHVSNVAGATSPTTMHVFLVISSATAATYPAQPALVAMENVAISDKYIVDVSLDLTMHCVKNLAGAAQLYEIWEMSKQVIEQVFAKEWRPVFRANASVIAPAAVERRRFKRRKHARPINLLSEKEAKQLSTRLQEEQKDLATNSSAFKKMQKSRAKLPSSGQSPEIVSAVNSNQVVLISGETGCGKTTQIPQFLLDDLIEKGEGGMANIICTQPRRLAAIGVASRVADERCEKVGETVGYQIRLESKVSPRSRLVFMTTGILLRRLQSDPLLEGVTHVIVDEVHERNVDSDFLLSVLKTLLPKRKELRLVLMSATMEAETFARYYSTKSIIKIPGFVYPVEDIFLKEVIVKTQYRPPQSRLAAYLKKKSLEEVDMEAAVLACLDSDRTDYGLLGAIVRYIDSTYSDASGAVLVFMSGTNEIKQAIAAIESACSGRSLFVLPLHGALSGAEQSKVFARAPKGQRKVVVSTNVAETSLTIDDVVYVVDSGRIKETRYDPVNRMSMLVETWVSRNSARQRRGRAGRVQSGFCFKAYSRKRHDNYFDQTQLPEIQRVPLEHLVLQVLSQGLGKPHTFMRKLMEPPDMSAVDAAITLLKDIDAVTDSDKISPLGRHIARLPMDVRVAKMLIYGTLLGCSDQSLTIAAGMSTRNPFMSPADKRDEADAAKQALLGDEDVSVVQSDHICLMYAFERFAGCSSERERRELCKVHFLSYESMKQIRDLRRDFAQTLRQLGFNTTAKAKMRKDAKILTRESVQLVKAAICAGLYPNVINVWKPVQKYNETSGGTVAADPEAKQLRFFIKDNNTDVSRGPSNYKGSTPKMRVFLHPSSINFKQRNYRNPWMVYREKVQTSRVFVRDASVVPPYCLLFFGGKVVINHEDSTVTIDDWITLRANPRIAALAKGVKTLVDQQLSAKFENPNTSVEDSPIFQVLRKIIIGSGFSV